jgi:hypothetical protein
MLLPAYACLALQLSGAALQLLPELSNPPWLPVMRATGTPKPARYSEATAKQSREPAKGGQQQDWRQPTTAVTDCCPPQHASTTLVQTLLWGFCVLLLLDGPGRCLYPPRSPSCTTRALLLSSGAAMAATSCCRAS